MSKLPKTWTRPTPLSKTIAAILFVSLPFVGFLLGTKYQSSLNRLSTPSNPLTATQAIDLIKHQPEVVTWLSLFTNKDGTNTDTGSKPVFTFDSLEGEDYIIHVYESFSDHKASFNWYHVNRNTGEISREFNSSPF